MTLVWSVLSPACPQLVLKHLKVPSALINSTLVSDKQILESRVQPLFSVLMNFITKAPCHLSHSWLVFWYHSVCFLQLSLSQGGEKKCNCIFPCRKLFGIFPVHSEIIHHWSVDFKNAPSGPFFSFGSIQAKKDI